MFIDSPWAQGENHIRWIIGMIWIPKAVVNATAHSLLVFWEFCYAPGKPVRTWSSISLCSHLSNLTPLHSHLSYSVCSTALQTPARSRSALWNGNNLLSRKTHCHTSKTCTVTGDGQKAGAEWESVWPVEEKWQNWERCMLTCISLSSSHSFFAVSPQQNNVIYDLARCRKSWNTFPRRLHAMHQLGHHWMWDKLSYMRRGK